MNPDPISFFGRKTAALSFSGNLSNLQYVCQYGCTVSNAGFPKGGRLFNGA